MNFDELKINTLGQISLSQKKFSDGVLIVSGIRDDDEYVAIDVRFYLEREDGWMPTKTGFWVGRDNWEALNLVLTTAPEDIGEVVCWKSKTRKFIVRYMPDYGGGIDFRYYQESAKYTGWEKKGIRIARKDYPKINKLILNFVNNPEKFTCGKGIYVEGDQEKVAAPVKSGYENGLSIINNDLLDILA